MTQQVLDPVCGMMVDPDNAKATVDHNNKVYYFCCPNCAKKFEDDPEKFLNDQQEDEPTVEADEYFCPMCEGVVSEKPGSCPKCGMALEPRVTSADAGPSEEEKTLKRDFIVGLIFTIPLFILAMGPMITGSAWLPMKWSHIIQFILATPVVLWSGSMIIDRAWNSILQKSLNMFTLIGLGVGTAYIYSLFATFMPHLFPEGFRTAEGLVEPVFESAAMITVLVLLGQLLEIRARRKTGEALRSLLNLAPKTARRVQDNGNEEEVELSHVKKGDILRVRPGERVPVDGSVTEGESHVDESMITGESEPVFKSEGTTVIGGTMNSTGSFLMRAEKVGSETMLSQIVSLVSEAQRSRAPVQRLVDQVSRYFVPGVVLVSLLTFALWAWLGPSPRLAHGLISAVAVLIIACPCALGLATPMAIMVGTGRAAEKGILFRNAEALETLWQAEVLVVDKTGTLTEGKPSVVDVKTFADIDNNEAIRLAASVEQASEHPLGEAIVRAAKERELPLSPVESFDTISGKGAIGKVEGKSIRIGSPAMMKEEGIDIDQHNDGIEQHRREGQTVILMTIDNQLSALFAIADPIRESTMDALQSLRSQGMRIIMLTGDSRTTAESVAKKLDIEEVHAEVLPKDKDDVIQKLQKEGHRVAMAGDGINDAPALARADIGLALGTGTDVAMQSAGVTLVHGDLRAIDRARRLSEATIRTIRQNLFLAFIYNTLSIPIAAGLLYLVFGILSPAMPIWAGAAMSLSSLSVVGNSLRLRSTNRDK